MRQLLDFHRIISPQQTPLLLILVTGEKEVFPPPSPSASQNGPISRLASSNSLKGFLVLSTSLAAVAAFLQQQRRRRRLWPQQPPHPPKGKFAKGRPRARGRSPKFQFVQRGVTSQPSQKRPPFSVWRKATAPSAMLWNSSSSSSTIIKGVIPRLRSASSKQSGIFSSSPPPPSAGVFLILLFLPV